MPYNQPFQEINWRAWVVANMRQKARPAPKEDEIHKKKIMSKKVIDESTRGFIPKDTEGYVRGVVYISKDHVEFGWFKSSPDNIVIRLRNNCFGGDLYTGISKEALPDLVWSNTTGCYITPYGLTERDLFKHKVIRGQGNFPYQFPRKYEAAESFHLFKDVQRVVNEEDFELSKHLNYTFGLEFETSQGYIPQEICFRDGLIPLRDGSISGIEYSTVVLEGNKGVNLLKQQLETLKKYTAFNKECALHIHMGGYPVDPISIYALYSVWYAVERDLEGRGYVPGYTFYTSKYKANNKDYCKQLPTEYCFEDLFAYLTGKRYLGSLVQPHPADVEKRAKWNIKSRYYGLNLINMVCYKGPKTVEFRFLRPTFNFKKIALWLYILNGVLNYAKSFAEEWKKEGNCSTENMTKEIVNRRYKGIRWLLEKVYSGNESLIEELNDGLDRLQLAVQAQHNNGDYCGRDTFLEDELFT